MPLPDSRLVRPGLREAEVILRAAQEINPLAIGFSLIFQFYVQHFEELASYLRQNGISCHFTMGGHYPSLSYQQALELVPAVDSAVLFEGELTLLELVDRISLGQEWRGIDGIAYRQESQAVANPLRALVRDLDDLPYPDPRPTAYEPSGPAGSAHAGKQGLYTNMFLLFYPCFLPHGSGQGCAHAQPSPCGGRNADAP